jgi:dTDP-4-amino-4,6-dideoxygalactose transaminase
MPTDDLPAVLGGQPLRPQGPPGWPPDDPAIVEVLHQAAADGSWGRYHGPHTQALALQLAELHGFEYVLLCASGTAAVELALRGLKIGAGDEVILAAYDFRGNMQDVLCVGATPVLVDVRPENWNLDVQQVEEALTDSTRALLVSHLHGGQVDMPALRDLADQRGIAIIEDACQVPGARVAGRIAGAWGEVAVLSFGGSKLLSAGRGGALLTGDESIVQRVKTYTQRGNEAYPLSELQAALLLPQLESLAERNQQRATAALKIIDSLADHTSLAPFELPSLPDSQPGLYKLGFKFQPGASQGLSRDAFAKAVRAEGVAIDPGFRSLHKSHGRRRFTAVGDLAEADRADENVLVMHHPLLLEPDQSLAQVRAAIDRVTNHAEDIGRELGFTC